MYVSQPAYAGVVCFLPGRQQFHVAPGLQWQTEPLSPQLAYALHNWEGLPRGLVGPAGRLLAYGCPGAECSSHASSNACAALV